jgi:ribose/xylose/arabinose/galactoside ABC-type transport system permease subunit
MSDLALGPGGRLLAWRSVPVSRWLLRGLLLVVVGIILYAGATTQGFFTVSNGKAILSTTSLVGIIAIGATVVMIGGNLFSITIGTTVAITAMAFLFLLKIGIVAAITLSLMLGGAVGAVQGALVGAIGANPIIVTIGAGAIQEGVSTWLSNGSTVYPPAGDKSFSFMIHPVLGLPFAVYTFIVLALVVELAMRRTVVGRQIYLMGENRLAARAAALPVTRLTVFTFAVASVCAAVAGVLVGGFNENASLLTEGTFSFDAIAAVLVGGSAVSGGRGSIGRTVFGALLIGAVSDLLLLRGYNTAVQILVRGAIVLVAVVVVHISSQRSDQ